MRPSFQAVLTACIALTLPQATLAIDTLKDCDTCPEMVVIPAGQFLMGSSASELHHNANESPEHRVHMTRFALARHEITQAQWRAVMHDDPSYFKSCDDCPVENVSWSQAQAYISKLNVLTGQAYRLPTEAEWEYACRAGQSSLYCGGDIEAVAWYGGRWGRPYTVATKQANAWGLYDMSGNVWEWVEDCYHRDYRHAPADGTAWTGGCNKTVKVLRGGSWMSAPLHVRAASRLKEHRASRIGDTGFRLARTLPILEHDQ